ncbi:MAG: ethanolamine ammonia-lyase subunit EutB, partial [Bacteroidota bacterium]
MQEIGRREFIIKAGIMSSIIATTGGCGLPSAEPSTSTLAGVKLAPIRSGEDLFAYIKRQRGKWDVDLYRQLIGAANEFKEGDLTLGVAAEDEVARQAARKLLTATKLGDLERYRLFEDEQDQFIREGVDPEVQAQLADWTMGDLQAFTLNQPEGEIKGIMPGLSSDIIACLVKLMSNEELIAVGQKVFNPLPGSKIGSKGYLSARIQPNSPTDDLDDITWQVFDAWSYAVGDLVLGTNPVSSEPQSVAGIEAALLDILQTFDLQEVLPNCVLAHIDVQAEVEAMQPGSTGIWFQSLAGTVNANRTFDVSLDKMKGFVAQRKGRYGLYAETGQGADFTNGHGEGFDMVVHEARKYGLVRRLKQMMPPETWVHLNDVAGFIGPEVFKSKEQLVRCCLEDTVMGKLHGLCIGLDICSTLHMDVSLDDLDWCIDQVMPANPAYLMALPTKNDPMLSYLTTSFADHVRIREQFGYRINDAMWAFFQQIGILDARGYPTQHFGDPIWVYLQYLRAQGDLRSVEEIYAEGKSKIAAIRARGVAIAEGHGEEIWDLRPDLDQEVRRLYADAKESIWTELPTDFSGQISGALALKTESADRVDYVYHPESGESLGVEAGTALRELKRSWANQNPDLQLVISDGLNARAIMDEGHLAPYLRALSEVLGTSFSLSPTPLLITYGRVRAGYACGEQLFAESSSPDRKHGIIHLIGERPGTGHHNYSVYLTVAESRTWQQRSTVDHNITRVISG